MLNSSYYTNSHIQDVCNSEPVLIESCNLTLDIYFYLLFFFAKHIIVGLLFK